MNRGPIGEAAMSFDAIASELGVSVETVHCTYRRAIKKLQTVRLLQMERIQAVAQSKGEMILPPLKARVKGRLKDAGC